MHTRASLKKGIKLLNWQRSKPVKSTLLLQEIHGSLKIKRSEDFSWLAVKDKQLHFLFLIPAMVDNRSCRLSFGAGLPHRAGINFAQMMSSIGWSIGPMFSVVLIREADYSCFMSACRLVWTMEEWSSSSSDHFSTLPFTYSSVMNEEMFPFHVTVSLPWSF